MSNNIRALAARLGRSKDDTATGVGVIIDNATLAFRGRVYPYRTAVGITTYVGKKVYCYLLSTGVAVVVGD